MSLNSVRTSRFRHARTAPGAPAAGLFVDTRGPIDESPIDRAHLARYTLGSPDLEREILGLFVAQLPLNIEQLRFAATDREWQVAAHTIKGSARAVGATEVARLALEAEQLAAVEDESARVRILSALEEGCEAVHRYLTASFSVDASRF